MTQPPPGYPEPSASQPPPGYPQQGFQQPGYAPPGYGRPGQPFPGQPGQGPAFQGQPQPGQPQPGQPQPGQPYPGQPFPGQPYPGQPGQGQPQQGRHFPGQAPQGQRSGSAPAAPSRSRPALPPLPVLAVFVVGGLAVLNAIFGFLGSAKLTATGSIATPLGSVYAVAGWIPALLVVSGLAAAATRLKGVSVPTLWAVSASTAVTGGVGALFYLVAREGTDAGLGFVLRSSQSSVGSSASAGLVLIVLFGLLQLVAAVGGLLLTQSPQLAHRTARAPKGGADSAHRYGPGQGPGQGPGGSQGGPWGPPTGGFPGQAPYPQGRPADGPQNGPQPQAPGHDVGPGGPQNERPDPGAPGQAWSQPPATGGSYGGPTSAGIAPYGGYSGADQNRYAPAGGVGVPDRQVPQPTFFDPQTGSRVPSGLTGTTPPPAPPAPIPTPVPVDGPPLPAPAAPAEYQRTEYGSPDFEWEPTYSEAPTYEARAEEEQADEEAHREELVHYEGAEARPQYEPPRLDSARHEGWDAGFAEDTLSGTGQPPADPRYRSIPRAE